MIDPRSDRPQYRQLADLLRRQIEADEFPADSHGVRRLPSEADLGTQYDLARPAVRAAIDVLRLEWLVSPERGYRTRIREHADRSPVELPAGATAAVRPASDEERARFDLDEVVPVVEIHLADGTTEVHAADGVRLTRP
jgi:DNA-binding GntR family transcriptional regulator